MMSPPIGTKTPTMSTTAIEMLSRLQVSARDRSNAKGVMCLDSTNDIWRCCACSEPPLSVCAHLNPSFPDAKRLRSRIKHYTKQRFGTAVWPHLFRDCLLTLQA